MIKHCATSCLIVWVPAPSLFTTFLTPWEHAHAWTYVHTYSMHRCNIIILRASGYVRLIQLLGMWWVFHIVDVSSCTVIIILYVAIIWCWYYYISEGVEGGDRSGEGGVTLLAQLANMPSMSPLITSPVPSVGSVVPNTTPPSMLTQQQTQSLPTTIVITTNGLAPQAPEVCMWYMCSLSIIIEQILCMIFVFRLPRMWRLLLK